MDFILNLPPFENQVFVGGLPLPLSSPSSDRIRSVAQSCPTLCDPMNRSTPGLPVHHQLPEFTQTHVHRVSDAIPPSHPLLSPSPYAPNPSQHHFVKDKVSIGAGIYLWAFYFVPLIYISVFVSVPYFLDDCGFVVEPEVRQVDSSSSILLSQDCFGYSRFFVFPYKL